MPSPKEVIEKIRKVRFGIGLDRSNIPFEVQEALKDKEEVLKEAARLAKEIYTKRPRFVFELIQNAEDNEYRDGIRPRIRFIIKQNELVVQNNENGFEEKNVWALCAVGGTTKEKKILGYIGEKGIGFKSVFMITDQPRIYSNQFQFMFQYQKDNPTTLLIPHWIEKVPKYVNKRETNIILPFKSGVKEEIDLYIKQIHPSLLLFLTKLKAIEIKNKILGRTMAIERYDRNGIVEIKHGNKHSYWKMVRKLLNVPKSIEEERRKDIYETEVVLAFPLNNDGSADTSKEQEVFAFLPIRKYGFKFIIQADFLLPVGREDIIKDSEWNKYLRDCIPSVFLDSVEQFKADDKLKYTFYNYIPIEKEVNDDFFMPVVEEIYKYLRETEFLLTESNQWKKPSDVLVANDEIRKLVTNNDLRTFFKKEYLSSKIKIAKDVLRKLNVNEFSIDSLFECLKDNEWVGKQDAEWFALLYQYLSRQELTNEQIDLLKKLRIIKLENGRLTSIDEGPVFFPISRRGKDYGFENELRIIKKDILEFTEKLERKEKGFKITDFLKNIGIKTPHPYEIIENHIIPIYENETWKEKDDNMLLGYVQYIKDNFKQYSEESDRRLNSGKGSWQKKEDPLQRLKKSLLVRINEKGEKRYEHVENVYLPKMYGNRNDLEILFQGIDVNFLHLCYIEDILKEEIEDKMKNEKIRRWRNFFLKLGVNDLLIVKKDPQTEIYQGSNYAKNEVTRKRIPKWEKEKTIWRDCEWKDTDWCYYIKDDWISEDFDKFIQKLGELPEDIKINLCKKMVLLLDKNWQKYKRYSSCRYYYRYFGRVGWIWDKTLSTFLLSLRSVAWCPTTQNVLAKPSQIFLDKLTVREVLGDSVFYLTLEIKNEDFIKDVGFNTQANVEGVLSFLKASVEKGFYEKIHFQKIYDFLNRHFEENEQGIRDAFSNHPLIYVPNTEKRFFTSREVLWKDVRDVFGGNRAYLEKHYPRLKSFFVEKLCVPEKPTAKDYADVLVDISMKGEVNDKDKEIIVKIYEELNYYLDPNNVEKPISEENWWKEFVAKEIYLTERNEFWSNVKSVFVNDKKELYGLFKDKEDVAFLWLPRKYNPDKIKYLINATGIRYLSNAVEVIPIIDEDSCSEQEELTKQIQNLMPYIIRYLYWKENAKYEEFKKNGFFDIVMSLKVYTVEELRVRYTINIDEWNSISIETESVCIPYQNKLYILKGSESKKDYIPMELSRIFGQIKGLDSFLILIYEKQSSEKIEDLLKLMDIETLPESESRLLKKFPFKVQAEQTPTILEKKIEHSLPPTEQERVELPPLGLVTEKTIEEWVPECSPNEAEISEIDEYKPTEKIQSPATGEDIKTRYILPERGQSTPSPEAREEWMSEKSKVAIGRWGEEYVLECLKRDKIREYSNARIIDTVDGFILEKNGETLVKVTWLNKNGDQGRGCDVEFYEKGVLYYIEVKSTKTSRKDWFDVSKDQWEFMQEMEDRFFIYRVYGAGTKSPRLLKIRNPAKLWREGKINAFPTRIQL
jgi:hypothetical protein